jgi:TorA maturation chaperone TorD
MQLFFVCYRTKQTSSWLYSSKKQSDHPQGVYQISLNRLNMDLNIKSEHNSILKGYNMLLYFAGSMVMYEPSEECVTDFWKNGVVKNLPVSSLNPNFIKAASQLRESCLDSKVCGKMMHEDYLRLFSKDSITSASPFESQYLKNADSGKQKKEIGVTEFYQSYGWKSKFKGKISDDHIGVELLFLTLLVDKYIALDDYACMGEMRTEIRRYLNQHLLWWLPEWNKKVQTHSATMCFKGIGTLILACCEDIYSMLAPEVSLKTSTDFLKN